VCQRFIFWLCELCYFAVTFGDNVTLETEVIKKYHNFYDTGSDPFFAAARAYIGYEDNTGYSLRRGYESIFSLIYRISLAGKRCQTFMPIAHLLTPKALKRTYSRSEMRKIQSILKTTDAADYYMFDKFLNLNSRDTSQWHMFNAVAAEHLYCCVDNLERATKLLRDFNITPNDASLITVMHFNLNHLPVEATISPVCYS
jgi:hypothetical protein